MKFIIGLKITGNCWKKAWQSIVPISWLFQYLGLLYFIYNVTLMKNFMPGHYLNINLIRYLPIEKKGSLGLNFNILGHDLSGYFRKTPQHDTEAWLLQIYKQAAKI